MVTPMIKRTSSTSLRAVSAPLPLEVELNELRSLVASLKGREADLLRERLDALEARVSEQAVSTDPGEESRSRILQALATANDGKPGHLSSPQLEERLRMSRSAVHTHTNTLEKLGKLWIRKTHGANGRPVFFYYHLHAVRA